MMAKLNTWNSYNIENIKGANLFKFVQEDRLLEFLRTGCLWFSRADKFGDRMECMRLSDVQKDGKINVEKLELRKRKHLITCFHENNSESLAFWDTYSESESKRRKYCLVFDRILFVKFVSKHSNSSLMNLNVYRMIHGKVKYKTLAGQSVEELDNPRMFIKHVAFRKERSFSYEREYRFDIQLRNEFLHDGINYEIGKIDSINFKILINPLLSRREYKCCKDFIIEQGYEKYLQESKLNKWLHPESY